MCDIEKEIRNWKRQLRRSGSFTRRQVLELESHLRDSISNRQQSGCADTDLFVEAMNKLGDPVRLAGEYRKNDSQSTVVYPRLNFLAILLMLISSYFWLTMNPTDNWVAGKLFIPEAFYLLVRIFVFVYALISIWKLILMRRWTGVVLFAWIGALAFFRFGALTVRLSGDVVFFQQTRLIPPAVIQSAMIVFLLIAARWLRPATIWMRERLTPTFSEA